MSSRALLAVACAAAAVLAIAARLDAATETAHLSAESCVFVAGPDGAGLRFLARGSGASWSPDGTSLAIGLVDRSGTRLVRRSGELIRELPQNQVAWLDGRRLVVVNGQGVYAVAHLGGAPTRALRAPPLKGRFDDVSVAYSARLIVVAGRRSDYDEDTTLVFLSADGRVVAISRGYSSRLHVVSPDGRRIAVTNDRNVAGRSSWVRLRNGQVVGSLASVVASEFVWSPTSTRLAVILLNTGSDMNATPATAGLYVHDVARKNSFRRIVRHGVGGVSWSPDGTRIAYYADALYTVRAAGGAPIRIAAPAGAATWSPDGTRIAYAAGGAIFTVRAGGGTSTRITPPAGYNSPTWSPDGKRIAFTRSPTDGASVPPCPTD